MIIKHYLNAQVIAACICRGKSMLAQTEMFVVFVLDEFISQGSFKLTAEDFLSLFDKERFLKVPQ